MNNNIRRKGPMQREMRLDERRDLNSWAWVVLALPAVLFLILVTIIRAL